MPFAALLFAAFVLSPAATFPAELVELHRALSGPAGEVAAIVAATLGIATLAGRVLFPGCR